MRTFYCLIICLTLICFPIDSFAQESTLQNPFDFPIVLSANFGELRSNHFHSGIDFKTQGVEGKPVHAVLDGFVSRIGVSPWGYGNVVYLTHLDGTTTVYAHLQKFEKGIAAYIKEQQYDLESFSVNLYPDSADFFFKRGEVIGLGGNSGSSGGPHLHFEVRDTKTEEILDPLVYFKERVKDTRPPRIQGLKVYPIEGRGIVNGRTSPRTLKLSSSKSTGGLVVNDKIEAWGDIAFGIKAVDAMDGTSNIYGVKEIILMKDSVVVFRSNIERYSFDESRYLNSFTDYAEWRGTGSFYMRNYVEPGNRLRFIESRNRGIVTIDEERTYLLSYLLSDIYGNTSMIAFKVEGKQQDWPEPDSENATYFNWTGDNRFGAKGVRLSVPRGNLYADLNLKYIVKEDSTALAAIHTLHNTPVPLHKSAHLSIRLQTDTLSNKDHYGIVRLHKGRSNWIGGEYKDGWIHGSINELASYSLAVDSTPPRITPLNPDTWRQNKRISIRVTDNLSGLKTYRGEIDGEFALFEFDGKKGLFTYVFDSERLNKGAHELKFTAIDACGNSSEYNRKFIW